MGNAINKAAQAADNGQWFQVFYSCPCGREWCEEWSCACDSECECGRTVEATDYECTPQCECEDCRN